jgi:hypothetical protein
MNMFGVLKYTVNTHEYTIVAFPQGRIPKGIESKEGMVGWTRETLFQ